MSLQQSFNKFTFYDQIFFFLQNEYIFKKDLYFICNTNIFCIKIYFSNEIYIFYIFIYIFICKKVFFSVKTFFRIKLFFHIKTFVKNTNIFSKKNKNFFFNLVLQQINNHSKQMRSTEIYFLIFLLKLYLLFCFICLLKFLNQKATVSMIGFVEMATISSYIKPRSTTRITIIGY